MPPKKADKKGATSQQDISQPYVCTGSFQNDFGELCRRKGMHYTPEVLLRPKPHPPAAHGTEGKETVKKGKEDKKAKVEVVEEIPELDECGNPLPKTFAIAKNKFHYFKPCVQVEMDNPDKMDTVTEMFIRGWKLDAGMLDILQQCWTVAQRLHTISLWNVGMNSDGLYTLAKCLPQCPAVKSLIFDGNIIKEENYYELLGEDSPLVHLSLRHCGITDAGAIKLASCLGTPLRATNSKLLSLNLAGNHIGDRGACALADGLQMNRTLITLTLSANQVGDAGAERFAQVLSRIALSETQIQARRLLRFERYFPIGSLIDRSKSVSPASRRSGGESKLDTARPASVRSGTMEKERGSNKTRDKSSGRVGRNEPAKTAKEEKSGKRKDDKADKNDKGKKDRGGADARSTERKGDASGRSARSGGGKLAPKTAKSKPEQPESIELTPTPLLDDVDYVDSQLWLRGNFILVSLNLSRNRITEVGLSSLLRMVQYQGEMLTRQSKQNSGPTGLLRLIVNHNAESYDNPVNVALQDAMVVRDPFYKPSGTPLSEDPSAAAAASLGHTREHTARSAKRD